MQGILNSQPKNKNSDLLSALISNVGILVQIAGVSLLGLTDAFGITKILFDSQLLGVSNFFIFIVTFSLIGTYTFYKDNKFVGNIDITKDQASTDKKSLNILSVLTVIFFIIFIVSSFQIVTKVYFININILGLLQLLAYCGILTTGTLNVYIWIRDAFSKQSQFNINDFSPNLMGTLRQNGYLKEPSIKILENIILSNFNHLVTFEIDEIKFNDMNITYDGQTQKIDTRKTVITGYDGKSIIKELTKEEREKILKNII